MALSTTIDDLRYSDHYGVLNSSLSFVDENFSISEIDDPVDLTCTDELLNDPFDDNSDTESNNDIIEHQSNNYRFVHRRFFVRFITRLSRIWNIAIRQANRVRFFDATLEFPPDVLINCFWVGKQAPVLELMKNNPLIFQKPCLLKWSEYHFFPWDLRFLNQQYLNLLIPSPTSTYIDPTDDSTKKYQHFYIAALEYMPQQFIMDIEWLEDYTDACEFCDSPLSIAADERVQKICYFFTVEYWPKYLMQHDDGNGCDCIPYCYISCGSRQKSDTKMKRSYHVVFRCSGNCSFKDFEHMKSYAEILCHDIKTKSDRLPHDLIYTKAGYGDSRTDSIIDIGVYTRNRVFRLIGSHKDTKTTVSMQPLTNYTIIDTPPNADDFSLHCHAYVDHNTVRRLYKPLDESKKLTTEQRRIRVHCPRNSHARVVNNGPIPLQGANVRDEVIEYTENIFRNVFSYPTAMVRCTVDQLGHARYSVIIPSHEKVCISRVLDHVLAKGNPQNFIIKGGEYYYNWYRVSRALAYFFKDDENTGYAEWQKFSGWADRGRSNLSQWQSSMKNVIENNRTFDLYVEMRFILITAKVITENVSARTLLDEIFMQNAIGTETSYPCICSTFDQPLAHNKFHVTLRIANDGDIFATCYGDSHGYLATRALPKTKYLGNYLLFSQANINRRFYMNTRYVEQGLPENFMTGVLQRFADQADFKEDILIKSNMGTGKTYLLNSLINLPSDKSVLIVTNRQALADALYHRMKDYIPGLQHYQEVIASGSKQWQSIPESNRRIVVQLDSLPRVTSLGVFTSTGFGSVQARESRAWDVVAFEESESLCNYMSSETLFKQRRSVCTLFSDVIARCKLLMVMDAHLNIRTMEFLRLVRPNPSSRTLIQNLSSPLARRQINCYSKETFSSQMIYSLRQGKRIAVISNSRTKIEVFRRIILKFFPDIALKAYTSNSTIADKQEIGVCNREWTKYTVVMWSPFISSGVDFSVDHFDVAFVYIVSNSSPAREVHQQSCRVRQLKDNMVFVYIDSKCSSLSEKSYQTTEELVNAMRDAFVDGVVFAGSRFPRLLNSDIVHDFHKGYWSVDDPLTMLIFHNYFEYYRSSKNMREEYRRLALQQGDTWAGQALVDIDELRLVSKNDLIEIEAEVQKTFVDSVSDGVVRPLEELRNESLDLPKGDHIKTELAYYYNLQNVKNRLIIEELTQPSVQQCAVKFYLFCLASMTNASDAQLYFNRLDRHILRLAETNDPVSGEVDGMVEEREWTYLPGWHHMKLAFRIFDHSARSFMQIYPIKQIIECFNIFEFRLGDGYIKNLLQQFRSSSNQPRNIARFVRMVLPVIEYLPNQPDIPPRTLLPEPCTDDKNYRPAFKDEVFRSMSAGDIDGIAPLSDLEVYYCRVARLLMQRCIRFFGLKPRKTDFNNKRKVYQLMAYHIFDQNNDSRLFPFTRPDMNFEEEVPRPRTTPRTGRRSTSMIDMLIESANSSDTDNEM